MNIDLLKKLVRLANNNPNEHEANAAARRACKLIEEGNFALPTTSTTTKPTPAPGWEPIKKPPPPPKRPEPPRRPPVADPFASMFYDEVSDIDPRIFDEIFNRQRRRQDYNPRTNPFTGSPFTDPIQSGNIKRIINCSECGQPRETRFRGIPEGFVCMECRGKEYQKKP